MRLNLCGVGSDCICDDDRKGGPTTRTACFVSSAGAALAAAGAVLATGLPATAAAGGLPAGFGGCDNAFAFWSVTTMSPFTSVEESSAFLSASCQLSPGLRHEQPEMSCVR